MSKGFTHESPLIKSDEWYTPPAIFKALRMTFDLDPCAPPGGLPWIPAAKFYSRADDGLRQPWTGRVWLNPPYGRYLARWLGRLYEHGDGIALVFARTDVSWIQRGLSEASTACFVARRVAFIRSDGKPSKGSGAPSVLLAYGEACEAAVRACGLGVVMGRG